MELENKFKTCTVCNQIKSVSEFHIRIANPDGLRQSCKVCKKEADKNYYKKNAQQIIERVTEYVGQNKEKVNAWRRDYQNNKYKTDINFKLRRRLRLRIYQALLGTGKVKPDSVINALGCSIDSLRQHLESQWQPGMTWENYGEWHVDHIKPLASFNLQDPEQYKAACHYTNLQPLWWQDNLEKADKW